VFFLFFQGLPLFRLDFPCLYLRKSSFTRHPREGLQSEHEPSMERAQSEHTTAFDVRLRTSATGNCRYSLNLGGCFSPGLPASCRADKFGYSVIFSPAKVECGPWRG
jgi:hypothetical protein